jgi:hypothetical protein
MEGKFELKRKSSRHVHTNIAKAGLNMLTLTCGHHLAKNYNIFMTAVDTGWVTDMFPLDIEKESFVPLDEIDGAMRVIHPIFEGLEKNNLLHSVFLKNYKVDTW